MADMLLQLITLSFRFIVRSIVKLVVGGPVAVYNLSESKVLYSLH